MKTIRDNCPNCGSTKLSWDSYQVLKVIGLEVPAPKLVLGCDECSETVASVGLDDVATLLNAIEWRR